jgi:hypothetical protein
MFREQRMDGLRLPSAGVGGPGKSASLPSFAGVEPGTALRTRVRTCEGLILGAWEPMARERVRWPGSRDLQGRASGVFSLVRRRYPCYALKLPHWGAETRQEAL